MLTSKKLELRRSEIRQNLAELANIETPSEDETRKMGELDAEYRTNETRYRAALIAEDTERRDAGAELETRSGQEWADLMAGFEMRQVALALDEGRAIDGKTAEIVSELRSAGGYRGIPVPWQALETRAGETVASGTPAPIRTMPIIDRLFPDSVASRMGAQMINIDHGAVEWPVTTSSVSAGWAATETGNVAGPTTYATTDKAMAPDHNLGIQMRITRKTLKQSGSALEQAVRRDMSGAMGAAMDQAVFLGSGASGQPLGILTTPATYGITETDVDELVDWATFRAAVVRFMTGNAAGSPAAVKLMIRPEIWAYMDGDLITNTAVSEWDRMLKNIPAGNIAMTTNGLAAPAGAVLGSTALMTTNAGGVAPIFVGAWGAVDVIRDPYSDAQSGGLRITALATMDLTVARPAQLEILTGAGNCSGRKLMLWGGHSGGLEVRTSADGVTVLRGRFPYSVPTVLQGGRSQRREVFEARAFGESIAAGGDVHLLVHHDMNKPLASRTAGSLEIQDSDDAMTFEATLSPELRGVGYVADFLGTLAAGLVGGISPGFRVARGGDQVRKEGDGFMRVVRSADLIEISAVTKPAYPAAQIEARNWTPDPAVAVTNRSRALHRWRA